MSPTVERGPDCTVIVTEAEPCVIVITFDELSDDITMKLSALPTEPAFFKFSFTRTPLEILAANVYEYLGRPYLGRSSEYDVDNRALVIRLPCNPAADPDEAKRHVIDYLLQRVGLHLSPRVEYEGER